MSAVTYFAKRGLIGGHTLDTEYGLDLNTVSLDKRRDVGRETQKSLSDVAETLWFFGKDEWSVRVIVDGATPLAALEEFLKSTEGGESFVFSPYGTVATPGATLNGRRDDGGYSLERVTNLGTTADAFEVSFTVREV